MAGWRHTPALIAKDVQNADAVVLGRQFDQGIDADVIILPPVVSAFSHLGVESLGSANQERVF